MSAERRRAATLDGGEHFQMSAIQPGSILMDEALAFCANDVCHLERWPGHLFCSFRERFTPSGVETCKLSSGFFTVRRRR
jgi:hypothetical protein